MSVIAVKGIPAQWSLVDVVKAVAKAVAGPFEPLNFTPTQGQKKTCYLRLSERLDPVRVVEKISSVVISDRQKKFKFIAYVPDHIPDLPLGEKKKKIPLKVRDQFNIQELELPAQVITNTHYEVFMEIQYKYPGLYNLSRKTAHKLLDEIARTIGERLQTIMEANKETRDSSFKLSQYYRKMHPHFGDFQLILSTLHRLQDTAGAPRTQISELELASVNMQPYMIDNVSLNQVKSSCVKYTERIKAAIKAHVKALDSEPAPGDNEELVARKKVREELKKMLPYLPAALRMVVMTHFVPEEQPFRKIRIYGEPFLPGREAMQPFTRRYNSVGSRIIRSRRMYNLLTFKVEQAQYRALRAMDATVINGAKLTIRSDGPVREVDATLRAELAAHWGGAPPAAPADEDEEDEHEHEREHEQEQDDWQQ